MQNISYVMSLLGREWLPGLAPAANVGVNVGAKIEELITETEGTKASPKVAEKLQVRAHLLEKTPRRPPGKAHPTAAMTQVSAFQRDAEVKAWVLRRAQGTCECCGNPAPFADTSGMPFLEVHHVRHLADGGPDVITNAAALCPNCHRALHYSHDSELLREKLYSRVVELKREVN
jgi:5-methylcytosine-specific restriction protein A